MKKRLIKCTFCGEKFDYSEKEKHKLSKKHIEAVEKLKEKGLDHSISKN